jgi:hypothetical protein
MLGRPQRHAVDRPRISRKNSWLSIPNRDAARLASILPYTIVAAAAGVPRIFFEICQISFSKSVCGLSHFAARLGRSAAYKPSLSLVSIMLSLRPANARFACHGHVAADHVREFARAFVQL